jgi:hypothetical protein
MHCGANRTRAGILLIAVMLLPVQFAFAGGGVALQEDQCIITIDFYTAHFTAYQPDSSGDQQFCEDLPEVGTAIFVLDYLHRSLKEVPVDFRIIRNATGLGAYARLEDVQALADIDSHTVFYRSRAIEPSGSYTVEHRFDEPGEYIGVVSAGHPTNDKTYYAVFPFSVGITDYSEWLLWLLVVAAFPAAFYIMWRRRQSQTSVAR